MSLLELDKLYISYRPRGLFGGGNLLRAVRDVSIKLEDGQTFGLVGESGSGKSTIGKAVLKLLEVESGQMLFDGADITRLSPVPLSYRKQVQVIFQDPYSSLNPAHLVGDIIGEVVTRHLGLSGQARHERVMALLEQVGLAPYHAQRYPYEFSGGQRQRIAIARALAAEPRLIVCDEAVSALDLSTQAQVINLLQGLQKNLGVSYLFIAHDLALVRHISHRIGVLYLGQLMEQGPAERVYTAPAHPYTEMLLASIPLPHPVKQQQRRVLRAQLQVHGETPSPINLPKGCPYHTRCPLVMEMCKQTMPEEVAVQGGGSVRCHLHTSGPRLAGGTVLQLLKPQGNP
jgi:oligopeptide/dipeptide ABC transporter ATP-binding protein